MILNLGDSVVGRKNCRCAVLTLGFVSAFAGFGGCREPKQNAEVSDNDQNIQPTEAASRGDGGVDKTRADKKTLEGSSVGTKPSEGISGVVQHEPNANLQTPQFYTVAAYDVDRDPAADLVKTVARAKLEQKRILLQVGGDWCNWCGRLAEFMKDRQQVRNLLDQHFLIMKVASQSACADEFLKEYPEINAYPFVYVLSSAGELLHSQDMEELELGEGYDEEAFVKFLEAWGASLADSSAGPSGTDGS